MEGLELTKNGFEDRGNRLIRKGKAVTPPASPLLTDPQQLYWWTAFAREAKAAKVPLNDLGLALALCVSINWEDMRGGKLADEHQFLLTRSGITRLILTSPDWQRLNDLDKQRKLESVGIATMAVDAEFQQALKPAAEQLSGFFLETARANKVAQPSMRLKNIDRVRLKAKANLDSILPPAFDHYVLNENGFVFGKQDYTTLSRWSEEGPAAMSNRHKRRFPAKFRWIFPECPGREICLARQTPNCRR